MHALRELENAGETVWEGEILLGRFYLKSELVCNASEEVPCKSARWTGDLCEVHCPFVASHAAFCLNFGQSS